MLQFNNGIYLYAATGELRCRCESNDRRELDRCTVEVIYSHSQFWCKFTQVANETSPNQREGNMCSSWHDEEDEVEYLIVYSNITQLKFFFSNHLCSPPISLDISQLIT